VEFNQQDNNQNSVVSIENGNNGGAYQFVS
jgi:hypothetical protein